MVNRKVAIMQPYVFPYIGYFQLMREADVFVYYNDTQFIERGWINRNQFLINKEPKLLTIPLIKASSSKNINEIAVDYQSKQIKNFLVTVSQNYTKAPYFSAIMPLLESALNLSSPTTIDILAFQVNEIICQYLQITTPVVFSSDLNYSRMAEREVKILEIASLLDAQTILFPSGSRNLYKAKDFGGYSTFCVVPGAISYSQQIRTFYPSLSMVDVLMFNSVPAVQSMLSNFQREPLP